MPITSIPRAEAHRLATTICLAEQLATAAMAAEGLALLEVGMRQVQEQVPDTEPWKPKLLTRWQSAIASYQGRRR